MPIFFWWPEYLVIATSLWYAVDYVYAVAVNGQKSLGFEWENVYYIQVGVLPQESLERDTTTRSPEMMTGEYLEFCNRIGSVILP